MLQRFYAVALNTFVETVRQPVYGTILLATTLLLIFNVSLAAFTLDDDNKLLLDLGLNTLLLSGLFLAAFSAAGVVSREIENRTVLTVISKPVSRPLFILAKFTGIAVALMLAFYLNLLVFILAQRHGVLQNTTDPWDWPVLALGVGSLVVSVVVAGFCNYLYGMSFTTTVITFVTPLLTLAVLAVANLDKSWTLIPFGSNFVGGQVIIAAYLVFLTLLIMSAVALAASTRFGQLATLLICTGVLGLGVISDHALGQYAENSRWALAAYHAAPNMGVFWVIDGLMAGAESTTIPFEYVGYATAYAALVTSGVICVAIAVFQKRELG